MHRELWAGWTTYIIAEADKAWLAAAEATPSSRCKLWQRPTTPPMLLGWRMVLLWMLQFRNVLQTSSRRVGSAGHE